ncbi:KEOPS complex subunit Cgi121 [Salinirussus salinus]|jgi:KEOPS complex subunit Cgi121|uniref:KEOPS complex subunit Cgi121 n=1 Tax=Salinirussus salinus TaxID=1198300 RepID=UPI001357F74B|nr:KEOPS complex subunit Cgi121 [Salinirussus salinus]
MEVVEGEATVADVDAFVEELAAVGEEHGSTVQAFDARYVVGREHIERAVALAGRARDRGEAVADDPAVEILLYAAGRRQITDALEMGVSEGECPVVAVAVGGDEESAAAALREWLAPAETLGTYDPGRVRDFFGVSEDELAATEGDLADVVLERVALLVVNR